MRLTLLAPCLRRALESSLSLSESLLELLPLEPLLLLPLESELLLESEPDEELPVDMKTDKLVPSSNMDHAGQDTPVRC